MRNDKFEEMIKLYNEAKEIKGFVVTYIELSSSNDEIILSMSATP